MPCTVSPLASPDNVFAGMFTESSQEPSSGGEYVVSPESTSGDHDTSTQDHSGDCSMAPTPSNASSAGHTGPEKARKKSNLTSSGEESSGQDGQTTSESPESERGRSRKRGRRPRKNQKKQGKGQVMTSDSSARVETTDEATTDNMTSGNDESSEKETTEADTTGGGDTSTSQTDAKKSAPTDSGWTVSEDCLLRSMKEGDETWANICSALNKSKKDVRAHWNIIKGQPRPSDADETDLAPTTEDTGVESSPPAKKKGKNGGKKKEEQPKNETKAKAEVKGKGKATTNTKWHKGARNGKVAAENKKAKAKAPQPDILSGEEASSEESSTWGVFGYGDREDRHQRRFLHDHIYKELYPAMIHPEPDEVFRQKDCEILATIDSKYKRSKWLEMQANFYNVTGRMVPIEAIRDRVLRAEEEEGRKKNERMRKREKAKGKEEVEERLRKVEKWMKKVEAEKDLEESDS
ncbi:Fc.00g053560.m01.CDS01 [Cosmosporella sp. VM-42]